jgi:hypothetical protein
MRDRSEDTPADAVLQRQRVEIEQQPDTALCTRIARPMILWVRLLASGAFMSGRIMGGGLWRVNPDLSVDAAPGNRVIKQTQTHGTIGPGAWFHGVHTEFYRKGNQRFAQGALTELLACTKRRL